jgi:hypothetical protein
MEKTETDEKGLGNGTETGEKDLETEIETGVEVLEIVKEDEKNRDESGAEAGAQQISMYSEKSEQFLEDSQEEAKHIQPENPTPVKQRIGKSTMWIDLSSPGKRVTGHRIL